MSDEVTNIDSANSLRQLKCCVIIPTYNNDKTLKKVIDDVLKYINASSIIVVNDGSNDKTASILDDYKDLLVIVNEENQGKGISLRKAFTKAIELGFENAVTIDSDGQHYPSDIPLFVEAGTKHPGAVIMGSRNMDQEGVPGKSSFGNKFSNFWFKIETGISLPDTQTGFRLYPLKPISKIRLYTSKFETEIEIIVKLAWKKVSFIPIPINVLYDPNERVSHFRPFTDFSRISILNTFLVTLTLIYYLPIRVFKTIVKEAIKKDESNFKKSTSIGFGVFMGILPIWGFQLIVGIPLSIFFKMNKFLFIAAANISIPPAIPFIIYLSYRLGSPFFSEHVQINSIENLSLSAIHLNFMQYIVGAIILSFVAGICSFFASFVALNLVRKGK